MMTTATHKAHDTTTERGLFVAFALRKKPGSSVSPRGMVSNHVRRVSQRTTRRACSKK
jgi:hypothetical protein